MREEVAAEGVRFVLSERWRPGPVIGWVGMNPSDASAERTDPTWLRWRAFATRWGFGGQIVVNPVPFRSATPADAIKRLQRVAAGREELGGQFLRTNLIEIDKAAAEPVAWVVGWGDKGAAMDKARKVLTRTVGALDTGCAVAGRSLVLLAFGLTAGGNPIHVLARGKARLSDGAPVFRYMPTLKRLGERYPIERA